MGMYRLKNILLGLGLGLVLASLININVVNKNITNDFIVKAAIKNGLIVIDPKDIINKENELSNTNNTINVDKNDIIEIKIKEDHSIKDIADMLYNNGLIDDKDIFLDYFNNSSDQVKRGIFYIKKGLGIKEVINTISKSGIN